MAVALHTTVRDAYDRATVTLPLAVRQALMEADSLLRLHGMQFEIVCDACAERDPSNPNGWTVHGVTGGADNSVQELLCHCTRRRFLSAF